MIAFTEFDSPLGRLSVAECKERILLVGFGGRQEVGAEYPALQGLGTVKECVKAPAAEKLRAYLLGKAPRGRFSVDLSLVRGEFDQKVLRALFKTRPGQTVTYGALAQSLGKKSAARAVGGAMRRNPIPIIVPCHRVLPGGGGLGNYTGGVEKKRWLLEHEGVSLEG